MEILVPAYGSLVITIAFGLLFLFIYIIIIRRVFKINQQVKLQQQQVDLLTEIAKAQGVSAETLATILNNVRK
jgi:hypothetical protein